MDINLVAHAKDYIDDLARGVDPFTKEAVSDDDIINNVKISRCLFFVSDVLGEVIANGGVTSGKAPKPKPDDFDPELIPLDSFIYSEKPVTVTQITKRINELTPENMKKLQPAAVNAWLVSVNMLCVVQVNGKSYKRPAPAGENIGISMERREGQAATYYVVLYNKDAQRFIVDNLPAVAEWMKEEH